MGGAEGLDVERKAEQMFLQEISRVARPASGEGESDADGRGPADPKGFEMGLVPEQAHRDEHSALTSALTFLSQSQSHLSRLTPPSSEGPAADSGSDSESDGEPEAGTRGPVPGEGDGEGDGDGGAPGGEGGVAPTSAFRWAQSLMSQLTSRVSDLEQGLKEREEVGWRGPVALFSLPSSLFSSCLYPVKKPSPK